MQDLILEGLTPLQVELAEKLWGIDTHEKIDEYINQLPKRIRKEAIYVKELMIALSLDIAVQREGDTQLAADLLRRYMRDPSC
jgi:hypothetical protein